MVVLTKRQQVLLDRLVTFSQWLDEERLPVRVLEAYGFGSFFRGKDCPHDVDLLLRCSREPTDAFRLFSMLLSQIRDRRYVDKFPTPQVALLHAFDEHIADRIVAPSSTRKLRLMCEQWIEGYTWNMLFTTDLIRELELSSPDEIAKRFVKRHLPHLNIFRCIGPTESAENCGLRAGFVVLLWSREKPDIWSHVQAALQEQPRRESILEDLIRFDLDLFCADVRIDLLKEATCRLLATPRICTPAEDSFAWLRSWIKRQTGIDSEMLEKTVFVEEMQAPGAVSDTLGPTCPSPSYDEMSVNELGTLVEAKRSCLKVRRRQLDVAVDILELLAWYKSGQQVSERSPRQFLVAQLLQAKSLQWWKQGRVVLAELHIEVPQHLIDKASAERRTKRRRSAQAPLGASEIE